ncbi:hypothetical protein Q4S45_13200 [Massilia sp. R2A-15]|uniref:hypothetical protein n=1 Tax=Massilia sp. R2A-15 TaxID=3064278 RepID=UPI00273362B3|nr:hypothetical protein [Massilia sp. R2A-15]WLI87698.1 hypothetical protein Q4S45_13200 [Massilia sp. R2A-15]
MIASTLQAPHTLAVFDRFFPSSILADHAQLRAARHLTLLATITGLCVPLLMLMYHFLGFDAAGMMVLTAGIAMMVAPFAMNAGLGLPVVREVFIGALYLLKVWMAVQLGGISAPTVPWFLLCPLVAVLVGGVRPGLVWGAVVTLTVALLFAIEHASGPFVAHPVSSPLVLQLVSHIGLFALATIIAWCFKSR